MCTSTPPIPTLASLIPELLSQILLQLTPKDVCHLSATTHLLNHISSSHPLWSSFVARDYSHLPYCHIPHIADLQPHKQYAYLYAAKVLYFSENKPNETVSDAFEDVKGIVQVVPYGDCLAARTISGEVHLAFHPMPATRKKLPPKVTANEHHTQFAKTAEKATHIAGNCYLSSIVILTSTHKVFIASSWRNLTRLEYEDQGISPVSCIKTNDDRLAAITIEGTIAIWDIKPMTLDNLPHRPIIILPSSPTTPFKSIIRTHTHYTLAQTHTNELFRIHHNDNDLITSSWTRVTETEGIKYSKVAGGDSYCLVYDPERSWRWEQKREEWGQRLGETESPVRVFYGDDEYRPHGRGTYLAEPVPRVHCEGSSADGMERVMFLVEVSGD
ncbi:hypothetical protein HK097_002690 [Rhizophlyctis rosea]|uniref:F-box domain-containing protein n=1 Tax=Rhizophlyctis rosea TaxID=64517 RepID=A0AAD5S529_9FUNG|nr:hypothetical protein HK097_002690 [Rhizophlyctis rosea]